MAEEIQSENKADTRAEAIKAWHAIEAKTGDELKKARAALVAKFPVLRETFSGANHE